jgi:hypothetical protein
MIDEEMLCDRMIAGTRDLRDIGADENSQICRSNLYFASSASLR